MRQDPQLRTELRPVRVGVHVLDLAKGHARAALPACRPLIDGRGSHEVKAVSHQF
jgi:hypothetical protein